MFNGSFDMSATSAGSVGGDISGKALASGARTCSGNQIYATITERIYNKDTYEDVVSIVIEDSDIELAPAETQTLVVKALYNDRNPRIIDNADLTITSATQGVATVSGGTITAVATGESVIEVVVTDKTSLIAKAVVTVE